MSSWGQQPTGKEEKIPQWAQQRIEEAKRKGLTELDLNGLNQDDKLTSIPLEIMYLSNLKWLDCHANQLTYIPNAIAQLTNLQYLDLGDNQLESIPIAIAQLTELQILGLWNNLFSVIPESIHQLTKLRGLYIDSNAITIVPSWLMNLPRLTELFLYDNPIESPPPEVLKLKRHHSIDLNMLRAFFRQQSEKGKSHLYEAKLLIVGEPGAGKTSLMRKLLDPAAPLPGKDESTEGIDVQAWMFPLPVNREPLSVNREQTEIVNRQSSIENPEFRVNIWDFGGQEIYHATHQFFLSHRSLYVVVADAREQKTDFFHWLDLIEHLSDRSPVFIFNNEIQNRHWAINEQQLQSHFPDTFHKPFAFNLADDSSGLVHLRQKIQEQISRLPHVGETLPATWVNVRRALEMDERATVTLRDFLQICTGNGFTRRTDALQLSGYLHDIGVILHFQDDPLLKKTVILKPAWGTDAAYGVLDNERVKANFGRFSRADLQIIWQGEEYDDLHDELLALMMKFQLCYEIPGQKGWYIAPQLLKEQPPTYPWGTADNLHLRYKYEAFMPKGLLARFIVAMHPHIAKQQLVWRTGVVLFKDNTAAEVVEYYHRREIRIRVAGKHKRDLLTIISYELGKLHAPFHRLKFDKLAPCNCATCRAADEPYFYRLEILKTRLEHGKEVIECDKPPFATVQIRPLLDDIGLSALPFDLPNLLRQFELAFDNEDVKTLCLELDVNYEDLPTQGRKNKMRELITYMERHGRLPDLVKLARQHRPNHHW